MSPMKGRATLADVARSAGVSVATVSKVVNGRSDVAPTTRARVKEILREQDYVGRRPDSPRAADRFTVELFVQGIVNIYSIEVIQGVLHAASAAGVDVVVTAHPRPPRGGPEATRATRWIRDLVGNGRRAAIGISSELSAADLATVTRARLPLVVVDPLSVPDVDVVSVGSTNFAGGLSATRHLLSLGHRRIAYLGGHPLAHCNQARSQGYRGAMESAGLSVPAEYLRSADFLYEDGLASGAAVLDLAERPTGIFAGSDEMALGVIEAARERGLRVPQDLSIVGFDDTQSATLASPQLTTIRQPLKEMGAVALRTALRMVAGETLDSHHVELATTLITRGSTAAPPADLRVLPRARARAGAPTAG